MSRTLVIDCATEACSVALFDGARLIAGDWQVLGRGHAERLVPMIATLPDNGRADRIAVDIGPGSFTGIRVGLAAAKALTLAWGAELVGYGALDLVAAMARHDQPGDVAVAMTGGHGEWFVREYGATGTVGDEARSLDPESAARLVVAQRVAGSQAAALVGLRGHGDALAMLPDARRFCLLAPDVLIADPRPAYGRPPDARLPQASGA